jgi:hypothetical protein
MRLHSAVVKKVQLFFFSFRGAGDARDGIHWFPRDTFNLLLQYVFLFRPPDDDEMTGISARKQRPGFAAATWA